MCHHFYFCSSQLYRRLCAFFATIQGKKWKGKGYFPSFPATSPYVTAVGGTQGPESGTEEIACQSQEGGVITTGTCVKNAMLFLG